MNHYALLSLIWVWVGGPKPVGRKSENERAEILTHKAENWKAENMIRPKKYSPLVINTCSEIYQLVATITMSREVTLWAPMALDFNYCVFIDIHG